MPDDETEQWAERLTGLPADAFIPLALTQPALAADLFRVLAETLLLAVNDWGVRAPRGAVSLEVAPEEALRVGVGDDRLTFRWSGDGDTARELVEMAVWQLADRWPAPGRGKQSSFVPSVSAEAWASSVMEAVTSRMTEELLLEEGNDGAQIAVELVRSLAKYGRTSNHSAVSQVLHDADDGQMFFAVYCLALLACEAAPSRESIERLHELARATLRWRE